MNKPETLFLFTSKNELKKTGNWYAMWINPESLDYPWQYVNNIVMTAKGFAVYHWRPRLITISVSGQSGWILRPSMLEELVGDLYQHAKKEEWKKFGPRISQFGSDLFDRLVLGGQLTDYDLSPRKFIENLRRIVEEDMFMEDDEGIEFYNVKYLHIFTKQFPEGKVLKGFATDFRVSERATDPQSIPYSFTFVVQGEEENVPTLIEYIRRIYKAVT